MEVVHSPMKPAAVIFDLDGVLCDTPDLHYMALNKALVAHGCPAITRWQHENTYDGLSTRQKLEHLGVPDPAKVHATKQKETIKEMERQIQPNPLIRKVLLSLVNSGVKVGCASNSVRMSLHLALRLLGISELFHATACNEDVPHPKPAPDVYVECARRLGVDPKECIAVEDTDLGVHAAASAGMRVVRVSSPRNVTLFHVLGIRCPHLIIPMAGRGSRFPSEGESKPFINVRGDPMIVAVHRNLGIPEEHTTFVVLRKDEARVSRLFPKAHVCPIGDAVLDGTACTVRAALRASAHIDRDAPVMVANCDQLLELDMGSFLLRMDTVCAGAGMLTFHSPDSNPSWSYVSRDEDGYVNCLAEKKCISTEATAGVYWWQRCEWLADSIEKLVSANDKVNGEFYLAPSFNYLHNCIAVATYPCVMHSVGVPKDLDAYHARCTPRFISHRGNVNGVNPKGENDPVVVDNVHRLYGCDVEVDVWVVKEGTEEETGVWLGHDAPEHRVPPLYLKERFSYLWCHAKNKAALEWLLEEGAHCFTHSVDDYTITSKGYVWVYPGKPLTRKCVAVKPEGLYTSEDVRKAEYVCSDFMDPTLWGTT